MAHSVLVLKSLKKINLTRKPISSSKLWCKHQLFIVRVSSSRVSGGSDIHENTELDQTRKITCFEANEYWGCNVIRIKLLIVSGTAVLLTKDKKIWAFDEMDLYATIYNPCDLIPFVLNISYNEWGHEFELLKICLLCILYPH